MKNIQDLNDGDVAVVGIPFDANSTFMRGPALAPARIRQALLAGSANMTTEQGLDLEQHDGWGLAGDLDLNVPDADSQIEVGVAALLDQGLRVLSLGGDHSITFPIMRALSRRHQDLTLIQLDAHPDLYDELDGNRLAHACPFARIMEVGLVKRLVQIGIRTLNQHQREQAERFGVEILTASALSSSRFLQADPTALDHKGTGNLAERLSLTGPIYLSLDLDVLDPAFAPGVFAPRARWPQQPRRYQPHPAAPRPHRRRRHRRTQPPPRPRRHDRHGRCQMPQRNPGANALLMSS